MSHMTKNGNPLLEKLTPILVLTSIGLAFAIGILWQKVTNLEGGGSSVKTAAKNEQGQAIPTTSAEVPQRPPSGRLTEDQASTVQVEPEKPDQTEEYYQNNTDKPEGPKPCKMFRA